MRRRTTRWIGTGAAVGLLAGGLVLTGPPATADVEVIYDYAEHAADMPTSLLLAQTLVSARSSEHFGPEGRRVRATVVLGGVPDADTDADLHLVFGTLADDGQCVAEDELVVSTFAPSGGATRAADTISLKMDRPTRTLGQGLCTFVSVTPGDSGVPPYDRLDGKVEWHLIVEPAGVISMERIPARTVRPKRWTTVRVRITAVTDASYFRVRGYGKGLKTREVRVPDSVEAGERIVVRLPVKLLVNRKRKLKITATAAAGAFGAHASRQVWIKPRRR